MNRLPWLNLAGVVLLVALSVAQWSENRDLRRELRRLRETAAELDQSLAEEREANAGLRADHGRFKAEIVSLNDQAGRLVEGLRREQETNEHLRLERRSLQTSLTNWMEAVGNRDAQLKLAGERIATLTSNLNDTVLQFNELATNHNSLVREFNQLNRQPRRE